MWIVEFSAGTLRFLDRLPQQPPQAGFVWIYLERESLPSNMAALQQACLAIGGSTLLELHIQDLRNDGHPSHHDYTSIYDLLIFRRLATEAEMQADVTTDAARSSGALSTFRRIQTRAVGFVVFDRLLITVHPEGCSAARSFIERYLGDALHSEGTSVAGRSRLPTSSADLMLRMLNMMVDGYLDLRKLLSTELDEWQHQLLRPRSRAADWPALMSARSTLHMLEELCEGQLDAVQEWLDTQREQPAPWMQQSEVDNLMARGRDVTEHIQRVVNHVQRMEQGAETAVQIHFSAQGHRTNEIMRTLTALTAIFLPLNLIAGIFGMNFDFLPLVHQDAGFWWIMGTMVLITALLGVLFWRKRYLARGGR